MAQLTVYYFGLICHVGDDEYSRSSKQVAAVLKDNDHERFIAIDGHAFSLESDVEFTNVPTGNATAQGDFLHYVPSVRQVFRRPLSPTKLAKNSYTVPYPADACLQVADLYPCWAEHYNGTELVREGCVARLTFSTATVPDDARISFFDDSKQHHDLPIGGGSTILIANVALAMGPRQPCGSNPPHGHIGSFNGVVTTAATVTVEEPGDACSDSVSHTVPEWIEGVIRSAPLFHAHHMNGGHHSGEAADGKHEGHTSTEAPSAAPLDVVTRTSAHVECGNTDWP